MSGPSLTVHPEHVSFCFLITALVAPPPPENGWGLAFDGPTAQRLLAVFLLEEVQDISSPTLSTLPSLLQRLQQQLGVAGAALANVLVTCLQTLQTPDDLVSLAARFSGFLAAPGTTPAEATDANSIAYIATSSPLGLFLRRVRLGLSTMSLQSLAALAAAVQQQVQHAVAQLQQQQQDAADLAAAPAALEAGSSAGSGALKEPAVLDAYLNTLLAAVSSLGACLPAAAVEAAAAPLSELQESTSKLQYLKLAVSLSHKDMHAALSALHQYFDINGSSSGTIPSSSFGGPSGLIINSSSNKGKGQHQSALHNLAALQVSLGHPQEALAALQELLRLGQQQGDEWSLLHGLASLCRVMGASEGLEGHGLQPNRGAAPAGSSSSSGGGGSASSWAGWGLLDLRCTEQQLQLQALLHRCLDSARNMRVPHIAAYAAVAVARFKLTHASSSSSGTLAASATAVPGLANNSNTPAATAASTGLMVQRMLLDVATLEHQAAVAASAPGTPAVAAAAAAAGMAQGQATGIGMATRPSELYNHTEAFGVGASTAAPGTMAGTASIMNQATAAGWRSAASAVTQALATGNMLAAAALQLQGAPILAGLRCLMVLNGPGGAGVHDAALVAALPAAAAAAAAGYAAAKTQHASDAASAQAAAAAEAAKAAAAAAGSGVKVAAFTGSNVHCDDVAAAWAQLVQVALELQGTSAGQHVLGLAEAHFPREAPQQLAVVREVVRLKLALQSGDCSNARLACEELQGLALAAPQLGLELQLVAADAHVQLLQAAGCYAEAHAAAAALFATAAGAGMQPQAVTALLLMAKARAAAGDASGALPYALSALLHCQLLQLDSLLPEAVLEVGAAWQALAPDGAPFVQGLLHQVLPLAHAEGRLKVRGALEGSTAKLQLALAEAQVQVESSAAAQKVEPISTEEADAGKQGAAGLLQGLGSELRERLNFAAVMLQQAGDMKSAACCWLLLAHVCNAAGLEQCRNDAADKWQICKQQGTTAGN